ncbi:MAG: STAS domain-containing protein [Bryobacteraceae bacterium]
MNIDTRIEGASVIMAVAGRMDADQASAFEEACKSATASAPNLVVDLSGLDYVSSMGLRAFLTVAKDRESAGARLTLVNLHGFAKQVFDVTRLTSLFHTVSSVEEALRSAGK